MRPCHTCKKGSSPWCSTWQIQGVSLLLLGCTEEQSSRQWRRPKTFSWDSIFSSGFSFGPSFRKALEGFAGFTNGTCWNFLCQHYPSPKCRQAPCIPLHTFIHIWRFSAKFMRDEPVEGSILMDRCPDQFCGSWEVTKLRTLADSLRFDLWHGSANSFVACFSCRPDWKALCVLWVCAAPSLWKSLLEQERERTELAARRLTQSAYSVQVSLWYLCNIHAENKFETLYLHTMAWH